MKKINFILNAKGGVGKSVLTYLLAINNFENKKTAFIDTDNSTQTSTKQLKFLESNRTETLSLLNENQVLIRDKLVSYLENLASSTFEEFFFDLGSPESEQMPALLERDIPFKEFLNALGFEAHFNIVIGGGGAYRPSIEYFQKLMKALKNEFEVTVWQNIYSFSNFPDLAEELEENCKRLNIRLREFGDFEPNSDLGSSILDGIRKGYGMQDYTFGPKLKLSMELRVNFNENYES
jgi:hypothetical protein